MADDDPLAALSAAAKKRAAPSRMPNARLGAKPPAYGGGEYRPGPRRPKKSPLLPIVGGAVLLVVIVVVAVVITIKLTQPPPQAPPPVVEVPKATPVEHPPGELFKNVPAQNPSQGDVPPPPDAGQ